MKKILIIFILIANLVLPQAVKAASGIWCAGDSEKIKPNDPAQEKNFFWDDATKTVKLHGAKNEYVAFQIIINASGERLLNINVKPDDFKSLNSVIGKENIDLFKEHYLNVTVPSSADAKPVEDAETGEYPTQMVPFYAPKGGAPFNVENNRNQPVWVDVYIPENAAAGEYESYFTITAEGKGPLKIKVLLTVWNFMLPHKTHFRTYIYYGSEQIQWAYGYNDSGSAEFRSLEDKFFQMAHQHRLNLCPNIEMEWGYDRFDKYWYERGRGKYIDGSAYTQKVGKGTPANTWVMLIDGFDHKPEYQRLCKVTLGYFSKKNLADILMLYVADEPASKENYGFIRERCQWVHEAVGKQLPRMVTVGIKPPSLLWPSLVGYVDIWNSGASLWSDMQKRMKAGDKIWTYNMGWGGGPYVDTPGISGRTQGWIAWKFGFDGWHFWDSCYWLDTNNFRNKDGKRINMDQIRANTDKYSTNVWENPMTFDQMRRPGYLAQDALRLNGDGVLFYPGAYVGLQEPISSFIMKSLRRGLQDYEYLLLAKKLGREKQIQPIVDSIIPEPKKWNKDFSAWYEARVKIAREILSALE